MLNTPTLDAPAALDHHEPCSSADALRHTTTLWVADAAPSQPAVAQPQPAARAALPVTSEWFALTAALTDSQAWGAQAGRLFYAVYCKRFVDLLVAGVLLLVLSPVIAAIALAIRLESEGAIIFRQQRVGLGGQLFTMYKFRSMRADRRGGQERRTGTRGSDRRRAHKTQHDPRITAVGKFLRRTSLDELPQLWNVVRGDMSLIGPRPELPKIVAQYQPWQHYRHVVRPGITGWWQVNGRSDRPLHENTEVDLYYIEHLSLRFDAQILLRTPLAVLSMAGAF